MRIRMRRPWSLVLASLTLTTAVLMLGSCGAGANSPSPTSEAKAFATHLLSIAPLPKGAVLTPVLPSPLSVGTGVPALNGYLDIHRNYVLTRPVDLASFIMSHRARGSTVSGPSTMSGTGTVSTTSYVVSLPFASRHISLEQIVYTSGRASNGADELRVDAQLQWAPIHTVVMPTRGRVTVTLYRKLSLATASSDPITVTLGHAQALKVRAAIESLSNTLGGLCMEDATLFTISASPGPGKATTWKGVAGECPDVLDVRSGSTHVLLSNASCALERLIAALFQSEQNNGTVVLLRSCVPA